MTPKAKRTLNCPACGTEITGKNKVCPQCGMKLDKSGRITCPFCSASIPERSRKCPSCRADLPTVSYKAETQSVDKSINRLMGDLVEIQSPHPEEHKRLYCPNCARLLEGTEAKCPKCGQILKGKLGLQCPICRTLVDGSVTKCPTCGTSLDRLLKEAKPMVRFDYEPQGRSSRMVRLERHIDSRPCSSCGTIVPKSFRTCPVCNTSFAEKEPKAEVVPAGADLSKVRQPERPVPVRVKVEAEAVRPIKQRRLKAAKVTTVPVSAQAGVRGHINGLGQVNGRGAVNGNAFVNGTGISNGLGARQPPSPTKRRMILTRWQFLAVLVAILIIIPTFVFLSYSNKGEKFSIDGNFADWDGATTYGTMIQSTSSTSNITEWAIGIQSSDLFFYFKTQAPMMSSSDAENYYLFVDTDGSNETGYFIESIGADYKLQLTGWNSAVNSTSLSEYSSSSDQFDWNAWTSIGSFSYSLDLTRLEAGAAMPVAIGQSAKFLLVSKDAADRGSASYTAPSKGGLLVVWQAPSADVAADGIIQKSLATPMLTLKFKCDGEGGQVSEINPSVVGARLASEEPTFSLKKGEEREVTVAVDTSAAADGQLVSAEIVTSGIVSSFAGIEIIGSGASAYAGTPPSTIAIDGAFADWTGRLSVDQDAVPVTNPSVDIDEVGNLSTSDDSFFYVSVKGEICSGTFVPATVTKPSGAGGGGAVVPTRHTAEDILSIYIDSDKSSSSGGVITLGSKQIGADQKIEVKGLFGRITSMKEFDYSPWSGMWVENAETVNAAKDDTRIEISVSAMSLDGNSDIDFIIETTSWKGTSDFATFNPSSMKASTMTWIVDPTLTSPYATSMSYQRKMFYDGTNHWSLFFDGMNTVQKFSTNGGQTWTYGGTVFATPRVNESSIWYDSSTHTVYAVGDNSSATRSVCIQVGTVNAQAHTITWAAKDFRLNTSSVALPGKNTYISKDANGLLWLLSSNCTQQQPAAYQLSAFKSTGANVTTSWVFSGQMLAASSGADNLKGSIVPAGFGSDVWAVYAYAGNVEARKYNGIWQPPEPVYPQAGSKDNTDNSPPSVVVDGKGVVHVVYGTGRKDGKISTPTIEYSHNETDLTTFTAGEDLDRFIETGIGDYYPTISLETSTGSLYVFWIQSDINHVARNVTGRKYSSGVWSNLTFGPQTTFAKQYLTSIYSASDIANICWQWTQNTTATIHVIFDNIPEFETLVLPIFSTVVACCILGSRKRTIKRSRLMR